MNAAQLDGNLRRLFGVSEDWDADGIQIDCGNDIKKAVISLDCTSEVIEFASRAGADAIINHHPLIFNPLDNISVSDSVGKRVAACIKGGISVLAYHTCLDSAEGGVNDRLCEAIGIKNTTAFLPFGRYGVLNMETDFSSFVALTEKSLNTKVQNIVDCGRKVKNIAVISGGGKDYIKEAFMTGADTYLTGEVNHAAMIDCKEYGMNLVCSTHFATENVVIPFLAEQAGRFIPEVITF
jgi:dinuclear metal center YbgI/SA1388 family protein